MIRLIGIFLSYKSILYCFSVVKNFFDMVNVE